MVLDITTTNGSHEWSDEQIPGSVPEDITSSGSVLEDVRSQSVFWKISIWRYYNARKCSRRYFDPKGCFRKCYNPLDVPEEISTPEGVSDYVNIRRYPGNDLNPGAGDVLDDPRTFPTGES